MEERKKTLADFSNEQLKTIRTGLLRTIGNTASNSTRKNKSRKLLKQVDGEIKHRQTRRTNKQSVNQIVKNAEKLVKESDNLLLESEPHVTFAEDDIVFNRLGRSISKKNEVYSLPYKQNFRVKEVKKGASEKYDQVVSYDYNGNEFSGKELYTQDVIKLNDAGKREISRIIDTTTKLNIGTIVKFNDLYYIIENIEYPRVGQETKNKVLALIGLSRPGTILSNDYDVSIPSIEELVPLYRSKVFDIIEKQRPGLLNKELLRQIEIKAAEPAAAPTGTATAAVANEENEPLPTHQSRKNIDEYRKKILEQVQTPPQPVSPIQQTLYTELDVPENANQTQIASAWKKISLKFHPNKGGNKDVFTQKQTAYKILSDPELRNLYDTARTTLTEDEAQQMARTRMNSSSASDIKSVNDSKGNEIEIGDYVKHISNPLCPPNNKARVVGFVEDEMNNGKINVYVQLMCMGSQIIDHVMQPNELEKITAPEVMPPESGSVTIPETAEVETIPETSGFESESGKPESGNIPEIKIESGTPESGTPESGTIPETSGFESESGKSESGTPESGIIPEEPKIEAKTEEPKVEDVEEKFETTSTVLGSLPSNINIQRISIEKYKLLVNKNIPIIIESQPGRIKVMNGYACETIVDNLGKLGSEENTWRNLLFIEPDNVFESIHDVLPEQVCFILLFNHLLFSAAIDSNIGSISQFDSFRKKYNVVNTLLNSPLQQKSEFEAFWQHIQTKYIKDPSRFIEFDIMKSLIISGPAHLKQYFEEAIRMHNGEVITRRFFEKNTVPPSATRPGTVVMSEAGSNANSVKSISSGSNES